MPYPGYQSYFNWLSESGIKPPVRNLLGAANERARWLISLARAINRSLSVWHIWMQSVKPFSRSGVALCTCAHCTWNLDPNWLSWFLHATLLTGPPSHHHRPLHVRTCRSTPTMTLGKNIARWVATCMQSFKIYHGEPKPHTKKIYFRKWPKQRDNVSRIAHIRVSLFWPFSKIFFFCMRLRFFIVYFITI